MGDMYKLLVKLIKIITYTCVAKKHLARCCSYDKIEGGVVRCASLCTWLPLVDCKQGRCVALV
jgi:hypothetical protein